MTAAAAAAAAVCRSPPPLGRPRRPERPPQVLYVPNGWMHATLNLDDWTVFMSSFL